MCNCNCGSVTITGDNLKISGLEKLVNEVVPVVGMKFKVKHSLIPTMGVPTRQYYYIVAVSDDKITFSVSCSYNGYPVHECIYTNWFNRCINSGDVFDIEHPNNIVPVVGMSYSVRGCEILGTIYWVNPNGKTCKVIYPADKNCIRHEYDVSHFTGFVHSGIIYDITYPNDSPDFNTLNRTSEENYKLRNTVHELTNENASLKAEVKRLEDRVALLNTQMGYIRQATTI